MTKRSVLDLQKLNSECNSNTLKLTTEVSKEFSLFCIWCKAYKNGIISKQNFDEYSQNERRITPWVKNKLEEMYF